MTKSTKQLINDIQKLKQDISPRSEWITLNRDVLLRQINAGSQLKHQKVGLGGYFDLTAQMLRRTIMEPAVMMLLVLGVFLSSSLTINAAFYSLPGDNLYPVKITLEKTHLALVTSNEKKVELKIEFAQKRVAELSKVISQNDEPATRKKKIEAVAKEFKNNVVSVSSDLAKIADAKPAKNTDPENSVKMALTVSEKAGELAKSFNESVDSLSETEKTDLEDIVASAVEVAQETSDAAKQIVEGANTGSEEGEIQGASTEEIDTGETEENSETVDTNLDTQSSEQDDTTTETNEVIE